jgi:hypothetical protein
LAFDVKGIDVNLVDAAEMKEGREDLRASQSKVSSSDGAEGYSDYQDKHRTVIKSAVCGM